MQSLLKIIFGHNYITSELIFAAPFTTFVLQKDDSHIFLVMLVVFHKSEILKNAVSERRC